MKFVIQKEKEYIMKDIDKFGIETRMIHAGHYASEWGSVVTPIFQTSTFQFKNADHGANLFAGKEFGYIYTRMLNPTVKAMEDCIASIEGGKFGLGCGSGMAAISSSLFALLEAGDHLICSDAVYGPTNTFVRNILSKYNVENTIVNATDINNVKKAIKDNTKVIMLETPGNPTLAITDLKAVCDLAKQHNIKVIVDNTFMSPYLQNPFDFGADVVVHSMTKFLNGHADVVGGIIIVKDEEMYKTMRTLLNHHGGTIDPFNAFLVNRGVKTLGIRMERHIINAKKVAEFLENHPKVDKVFYPGLKSHPQYELAQKQMRGPGGMIAFELKGGLAAGKTLMDNVEVIGLAVSLGGVESLIQHPASMTHAGMGKEQRENAKITDGLVRISVGIENLEDIISDLEQALNKI